MGFPLFETSRGATCGACVRRVDRRSEARPYPFPDWPGGDCVECGGFVPEDESLGDSFSRKKPTEMADLIVPDERVRSTSVSAGVMRPVGSVGTVEGISDYLLTVLWDGDDVLDAIYASQVVLLDPKDDPRSLSNVAPRTRRADPHAMCGYCGTCVANQIDPAVDPCR